MVRLRTFFACCWLGWIGVFGAPHVERKSGSHDLGGRVESASGPLWATPPASRRWRKAPLIEESSHEARIVTFARRYGIGRKLSTQIYQAARAERLHPGLAFSLVRVESGFDPRSIGPKGSIGLTQIQPRTARHLEPRVEPRDLYSPALNLRLGFRYLRSLIEEFDDPVLALTAYNRGPGHVTTLLARGRDPRNAFARAILRNVERTLPATL